MISSSLAIADLMVSPMRGLDQVSRKVMIIGLDGATWTLLDRWISNNKLPTFKKLMNSGTRGILKSTIPSQTCSALPAMFMGMNPGNTGVFSVLTPHNDSVVTFKDFEYPTIWNILDNYNYSSCVVNVRFTFPPEKLKNGIMICGDPVPSDRSNYTYPEELKEEIKGFRDDKEEKKILSLRSKKKNKKCREELLKILIEQIEIRYGHFKKLIQKENYDFSLFWIDATDILQHCCWEYKEMLLQLYSKLDGILHDILLNFPDREFFIVSDHGFESESEKFFFVNTWLYKEGYLRRTSLGPFNHLLTFAQLFVYRYVKSLWLWKAVRFLQFRRNKAVYDQNLSIERVDSFPGIDKRNSTAYLATLFGIDINDPYNYETTREEIIEKLEKLHDLEGERVVKGIWKKEEVYKGRYLKYIPDVIFLTSEKYLAFPALTKNIFGEIKRKVDLWRSGGHGKSRDGMIIAYGPAIREKNDLGNARLEDLTPTILHLLGCKIPLHIDGEILSSIFKKDSDVAIRKPLLEKHYSDRKTQKIGSKEEQKMRERLRELGYL